MDHSLKPNICLLAFYQQLLLREPIAQPMLMVRRPRLPTMPQRNLDLRHRPLTLHFAFPKHVFHLLAWERLMPSQSCKTRNQIPRPYIMLLPDDYSIFASSAVRVHGALCAGERVVRNRFSRSADGLLLLLLRNRRRRMQHRRRLLRFSVAGVCRNHQNTFNRRGAVIQRAESRASVLHHTTGTWSPSNA
jgi:hypothetical protein